MSSDPHRDTLHGDIPYRDIGSGFVRLSGMEAPRRARSPISCVEDILSALLENSLDANAKSIYVATSLHAKRYRTLIVIDDGEGIPPQHADEIFAPGTTSRILKQRSGLSLHHIRKVATRTTLTSSGNPTAITVTADTSTIPERTLQSRSRNSKSNLLATARRFSLENQIPVHIGSQSEIIKILINHNIIRKTAPPSVSGLQREVRGLGFVVSSRTLSRLLSADAPDIPAGTTRNAQTPPRESVDPSPVLRDSGRGATVSVSGTTGFRLGASEKAEITAILRKAAESSYLNLGNVKFKNTAAGISITADIREPEGEYDV